MKLTKKEIEELKIILEDYLQAFEKSKKHQRAHKEECCHKCEIAKQILKRLEK